VSVSTRSGNTGPRQVTVRVTVRGSVRVTVLVGVRVTVRVSVRITVHVSVRVTVRGIVRVRVRVTVCRATCSTMLAPNKPQSKSRSVGLLACSHIHTYIYMHIYIDVYIHICSGPQQATVKVTVSRVSSMQLHTYIYIHAYTYIHIYICVYIYIFWPPTSHSPSHGQSDYCTYIVLGVIVDVLCMLQRRSFAKNYVLRS